MHSDGRCDLQLPPLAYNTSGWGPLPTKETFLDVPVVPITRVDHSYKACDWIGITPYGQNAMREVVEAEDAFEVVDIGKKKKKKSTGGLPPKPAQRNFATAGKRPESKQRGVTDARKARGGNPGRPRHLGDQSVGHLSSVLIRDRWEAKHRIPLNTLERSGVHVSVSPAEDLSYHGHLHTFDTSFDFVSPLKPVPVRAPPRTHPHVSPLEDEVLREIVMARGEEQDERLCVVTNESILSTLLTAPRSIFSWDVKVTRAGQVLFLDWRGDDDLADAYTVDETSTCPPVDSGEAPLRDINSASSLSKEATKLCRDLTQMLVNPKQRAKLTREVPRHKNVFDATVEEGEDPVASTTYLYRQWTLRRASAPDIVVICRCQVDAVLKSAPNKPGELLRVFTLNEHSGNEWKNKMQTGRGAVLAHFIKTNACKFTRWATMATLSGVDNVKLAYATRSLYNSNTSHQFLGLDTKPPSELAAQVGLNMGKMWSAFCVLVDATLELGDGSYMLVREAGKGMLTLYDLGDSEDEEEQGEVSEEEEDA